jgi:copper chaperone CopZ
MNKLKSMKSILTIMMIAFVALTSSAQTKEVVIKTSAECGSCKKRIEGKLNYTAGIRFAELDVPSKKLTVKYSEKKISLKEIRKIISETGYDADEVKAIPEAVDKLPACCKPGGMSKKK